MKFLVLALCVCAASAASVGAYKPWQPIQRGSQAFAQALITPQVVAKSYEPVRVVKPYELTARPVYKSYKPTVSVYEPVIKPVIKPYEPTVKVFEPVVEPVVKAYEPTVKVFEPIAKPVVKAYDSASKTTYVTKDGSAAILRASSDINPDGFNYFYETENGIAAQSTASLKKVGNSDVLAIQGSYQYVAPDGTPALFTYVADENGYQVKSDLLPVAPAIPEAILRSLEWIQAHPQKEAQKY